MALHVEEISFEEISPYWAKFLWDGKYNFKPTSAMLFLEGYDETIAQKFKPKFFCAKLDGKVVGVLSGHQSAIKHYRARGLYVDVDYRNQGVATALLQCVLDEAKSISGCELLWAAPRKSSLSVLLNFGFKQESDFTEEGFLYGPNCYVAIRF